MKSNKEFLDLSQRNNEWYEEKEDKIKQKIKQIKTQSELEVRQSKQRLHEHIHKPKAATDHRTWKDIEFEEIQKRQERLLKRKEELKQMIQSPFSTEYRDKDRAGGRSSSSSNINRSNTTTTSVGLQRRHSESNLKNHMTNPHMLNTASLLSNAGSVATTGGGGMNKPARSMTPSQFTRYITRSTQEALDRKYHREERLLQKEQEEQAKKSMIEKHKYDKLMNAPFPYGAERMTRAAQERERVVSQTDRQTDI
jgi:hypothetical protein